MSFPTIPNITPSISLNRTDVINLLLASVAFEELGLAHIINAEGEKLQAAVGTLPSSGFMASSFSELLSMNQSVNRTLQTVLKTQMLLQFKLEDILAIPEPCQVSVIAREVLDQIPGGSRERFFGIAQGTNQVLVEILADGSVVDSTLANVINNQFQADLNVPEGLPPEFQVSIRVQSVENPNCQFHQLVSSIPVILV